MKIGYVRVSKQEQNEALQIDALKPESEEIDPVQAHVSSDLPVMIPLSVAEHPAAFLLSCRHTSSSFCISLGLVPAFDARIKPSQDSAITGIEALSQAIYNSYTTW
jgi:hypothetical protein